jgi:subtilisin family serine protease/fibronectin type 3 domain-containing protein
VRRRRSSVLAVLVGAVMLAGPSSAYAAHPASLTAPPTKAPAGTSWIVTLRPGVDPTSAAGHLSADAGGAAGRVFTHVLNGFVFRGSERAAAALARDPSVRTVVPDQHIEIADTVPTGIERIRADHPTQPDAHDSGFTGAGVRIAIIDTGIDLDHPDLVASIDAGLGKNCYSAGPPNDGHGHGTHVAGTAAAPSNGIGVIGVAPSARLVPIKVLSDSGSGDWSNVICGIDYVTGLDTDGNSANDVQVANMSLGDAGTLGTCTDGGLREAICESVAAGIVYVAAAGNSAIDAATFVPAAYPEVIAVSAIADFDGEPGGLQDCQIDWASFTYNCDDELASFSNYGDVVDVAAPGVGVYSTWTGGGYESISGTSMASPHVAGVAALIRSANPALSPAQVRTLIERSGDNPDGSFAEGGCGTTSQWGGDPDGIGEPLVNAYRAATMAADPTSGDVPNAAITSPADGASVSGVVGITATATDTDGVASVEFFVDGSSLGTDTTAPYASSWNTGSTFDGSHTLSIRALDTGGHASCVEVSVSVGSNTQGSWVGTYGVDGYVLGAWNGAAGDIAGLPAGASFVLDQGGRTVWASPTTDVRGLQNPAATERRAATWWDNTQIRAHVTVSTAYSGTLHLYAVDWDSTARRQNVTVSDGTTTKTVSITSSFNGGAWMHFPVSVGAGGTVSITVDRTAGVNAVVSGLFLGGGAAPTVPGAPSGLTGTAGNGQVALSWTAPASNGGSAITGYKIYRGTSAGSETYTGTTVAGTTYTNTGLTNGTTYFFKVSALNAIGEGALSPETNATPVAPPTVPGAPSGLTATAGNGQVALSWTVPASNGGSAITGYKLYRGTVAGGETYTGITVSDTTYTNTGLTNGTTYFFKVSAVNGVGEGSLSNEATATPVAPLTAPGAPTSLAASGGNGQVALSWTAPASNGGSAITGYKIYRGIVAGGEAYTGITVAGTNYTNTGLTNGTTYFFKVSAVNAVGEGSLSNEASATAATIPSPPLSLAATPHRTKGVVLTWAAPTSTGGLAITGYRIYRSTAAGTEVFYVAVGAVLTYRDAATSKGVRYYYTVTAVNAIGESPVSNEASAIAK